MGVWDEFYGSGKKGKRVGDDKENKKGKGGKGKAEAEGEDALAALILRRQKERAGGASVLDAIAAKYAAKEGKKAGKKAKAAEPHPDELDDEAFAALQAKMFNKDDGDASGSKKKRKT
jgi:DnaJ family protein C protein 9